MRFARPEYLYALALIPLLLVFYAMAFRRKAQALARFGNPELLEKMAIQVSGWRQRLKAGLLLLALALFLIALARPQMGASVETVKRQGIEIMIALDVSNSMLAEDVKPSRLERAKHSIRTLLDKLQGDRVGLVVFAGSAFLQCPITSDYSALALFLDGVDNQSISMQGTAIADAIQTGAMAFTQNQRKHKVMILLTDGESHDGDPLQAAKDATQQGIHLYTIGIGSASGEPIPVRNPDGRVSEYKRDREGQVVMSALDELTLEKIASLTDGKYYRSSLGENEIEQIYHDLSRLEKEEYESKEYTNYEEQYQILLLLGLLLFCFEYFLSERARPRHPLAGRFE